MRCLQQSSLKTEHLLDDFAKLGHNSMELLVFFRNFLAALLDFSLQTRKKSSILIRLWGIFVQMLRYQVRITLARSQVYLL